MPLGTRWRREGSPPAGARLLVIDGPSAGRALPLSDGAVLGRGPGAELRLDDPLASRRHARVALGRGRATLEDLGSKNGLYVNGRRAGRARALRAGDALLLGGTLLRFEAGPVARRAARRRRRLAALALAAALLALAAWLR